MNQDLTVNGTVVLPPAIDLRAVEMLKSDLMSARGKDVKLDASAVERLGGLGLQVLLSAIRTWKADGQVLTFANVTDALLAQWQAFGASPDDLVTQDAAA